MHPRSYFSLAFSLSLASVQAVPSMIARDSSFSTECTDIYLSSNWLVGTCPTADGSSTITSSVYLPSLVTNSEASLQVLPTLHINSH